jgi:polyribonucleotide nucleotidyltransferase
MCRVNEDGTVSRGEIRLPEGKKPFVLSQDDVSYYHYMDGDGFAQKLIVDENGKVTNTYVEDDGSISICGNDAKGMAEAERMIRTIVTDFEEGQVLDGVVVSIKEFGAFIEFAPGKEGMVHISKIAPRRIEHVEDVLTLGDKVTVVCLGKDRMGRLSFSIKDAPKPEKKRR